MLDAPLELLELRLQLLPGVAAIFAREMSLQADLIAEGDYVVGRWKGGGTHTGPAFSDFLVGSLPAATGWKAGVNCPAGTLDFWAQSAVIANGAAGVATHTERHNVVRDDMTLLTATITAGVDLAVRIEGRYKCTANGTFAARFANELAANTQVVVQQGSWGWWF